LHAVVEEKSFGGEALGPRRRGGDHSARDNEPQWTSPPPPPSPVDPGEGGGRYVGGNEPSIYALQRRGFALLDRPAAHAVVAEELARQALIGHRRGRVGRLRAAPADIGRPRFGAPQGA